MRLDCDPEKRLDITKCVFEPDPAVAKDPNYSKLQVTVASRDGSTLRVMEDAVLVSLDYEFPDDAAGDDKNAITDLAKKVLQTGTLTYDGTIKTPLQAEFGA
ncbi:MAG: hypothetical protein IJU51_02905 [Clostridia bacterium]|nr:hypothetical protein [Clostridia bacterium]